MHTIQFNDIEVIDWVTNQPITTLEFPAACGIMIRSTRFDHDHCTAAIRRLTDLDAQKLGVDQTRPVIFITK